MSDAPHWTEPGAYPVSDGIHRIPLPLPIDGLRAVNVYAIETEQGLTLVDGGWAIDASAQAARRVAGVDRHRVRDITRFLVTHVHRDHYTQALDRRRELGPHVSLGLGEQATLDVVRDREPAADPTVAQIAGPGRASIARGWQAFTERWRARPVAVGCPDTWLDGDQQLTVGNRTLDAVSTPGHTQGHFVFADRDAGLLFAGDHVLPTITPSIGFEPAYAALPLGDFLASLAKVRALPDLRLLPAHGAVTASTHARIDELVAHHDVRLRCAAQRWRPGGSTAYDVAARCPGRGDARRFDDLDLFNSALASMETMAHLELLAARGEITRGQVDGVNVYGPPSPPRSS